MIGSISVTLLIAACAGAYSILTDRSPVEVALSGQQTLTSLATDPHGWSVGALVALLMLKGIAYGASLGALRGGPIFPALFLGAAAGVLLSGLPGFGVVPAIAAGMAAATAAILPLPIASAVLVTLLLGTSAPGMTPIVLIAVVVAFVSEQIVERSWPGAEIDEPGQAEGRP
jgi:H+/Cl- antiporter ClcA